MALNAGTRILIRSPDTEEAELLKQDGAGTVYVAERELSGDLVRGVLQIVATSPAPSE